MIAQLYNLKQQQINQQVLLKQQAIAKINDIDDDILLTNNKLHTTSVDTIGAISDFRVLEIYKATMKEHIIKLSQNKEHLKKQIEHYNGIIVDLNKESEQFNYILLEMKREKLKEIQKQEDIVAAEYMQAKFIKQRINSNVI